MKIEKRLKRAEIFEFSRACFEKDKGVNVTGVAVSDRIC